MKDKKVFTNKRPEKYGEYLAPPVCAYCGKVRTVHYPKRMLVAEPDYPAGICHLVFEYTGEVTWGKLWYGGKLFCSLVCCEKFAYHAYKSGYRKR